MGMIGLSVVAGGRVGAERGGVNQGSYIVQSDIADIWRACCDLAPKIRSLVVKGWL